MADEPLSLVLTEDTVPVPTAAYRAVAAEYVRDFNIDRVAEQFNTTPQGIRQVLNSPGVQAVMEKSLGDVQALGSIASRRLLEALLEEAMSANESKGRTEARKLLARHFLPLKKEVKTEHIFYVESPGKLSRDDWEKQFADSGPVLPAEILDDDA